MPRAQKNAATEEFVREFLNSEIWKSEIQTPRSYKILVISTEELREVPKRNLLIGGEFRP